MSTQAEVNATPYQYILYYIGVDQKDAGVYPLDLSGVCVPAFTEDGKIVCNEWSLGASYPAPTNEKLLSFDSGTVLAWYDAYYIIPADIGNYQFYKISSTVLDTIRTDSSMVGYVVFDTTAKIQKIWNGTAWLPTSAATSSISSAWSDDAVGVTFTANTPKVVNVTGFTQMLNVSNEWKVDTTTGKHTYTGLPRTFRVTINYGTKNPSVLSTQTLTTFLSKNGSTAISGKRVKEEFAPLGVLTPTVQPRSLSATCTLATGDTIQLGASYSATIAGGGIPFSSVSYEITGD